MTDRVPLPPVEALLAKIEKFIDETPLKLGWRIAEQVEAHNSAIVDREYVEWLHVKAFLHELLNQVSTAIPSQQTWQPENEHAGGSLNGPSRLGASPNTDTGGECVLVPRALVDLTLELLKQTRLGLHGTPWAQGEIRALVNRLEVVASPRGGPAKE